MSEQPAAKQEQHSIEPTPPAHSNTSSPDGNSDAESPSHTVVSLNEGQDGELKEHHKEGILQRAIDSEEGNVATRVEEGKREDAKLGGAEVKLSQKRKWALLAIFSLCQYFDGLVYAGLFLLTDQILIDLNVKYQGSSWILTSYSVTFASFQLFWGRIADIYSARPVFVFSFLSMGIINAIVSVMPEQYSYFIMRAILGICGAGTVPAAYRLILAVFEPEELNVALTMLGLAGALSNVTGLIIAGVFGLITAQGQMAAWRWFFRGVSFVIIPLAALAFLLVPKTKPAMKEEITSAADRFKRLDLIGCGSMLFGLIALILSFTMGATYGFKTAAFLVPFFVSWILFAVFFTWEARQPEGYALLPASFWRIPNMPILIYMAIGIVGWWATNQLVLIERFLAVFHDSPIIAALRLLPEGIIAFLVGMTFPALLAKVGSSRWTVVIGSIFQIVSNIIFIFTPGGDIHNNNYWRWYIPGMIVGSAASMAIYLAVNISIMTSVPPSASGVAGAVFYIFVQTGAVLSLAIQAGLLTVQPGTFVNYTNVRASFWFQVGWSALNAVLFGLFYKSNKAAPGSEAAKAAKGGNAGIVVEGPEEVK